MSALGTPFNSAFVVEKRAHHPFWCGPSKETPMPILLWLLGVPIVVIILLYLFHVL